MRLHGVLMGAALAGSAFLIGASKQKILRQEKDRLFTREASDLSAPVGADLAAMEQDAMGEYTNTRLFANVGCNYATENIIILDNSSAIFDKELWMLKLLIREIAAAFLRVNAASRFGLILTTQPNMPLILPDGPNGSNIQSICQTVKGIQRVNNGMVGDVYTSTVTAVSLFNVADPGFCATRNLLLMTAPYTALLAQLAQASGYLDHYPMIRRLAVGVRMTQPAYQISLEAYVGCPGCGRVQYVGNCTPAKFLFLLKQLYPQMCVPEMYYREAAIMTFQVDGMGADDENLTDFVDKFLDLLSQSTGVEREYLEVIDVRDSTNTAGEQYNVRRLNSIEDLSDLPRDTLLDIVLRDSPTGLRDTPFRIAGRLDTDLRNDLSPVSSLFKNELSGIPKIRKIVQPRDSIFARPTTGLTFQKLYLGDGLGTRIGDSAPIAPAAKP